MLISKKIWLLVGIALVTCAAVSSFGVLSVKRVNSAVSHLATQSMPAVRMASNLRTTYLGVIPSVYERATTEDPQAGAALDEKINKELQLLIKQINEYPAKPDKPEEAEALDQAKLGLGSFISKMRQVSGLAGAGEPQLALGVIQRDFGPLHTRLSTAFDQLVKVNSDEANAVVAGADATFKKTLAISIGASLAGLAVIAVIGALLARSITHPLSMMERAITRTATELDFTTNVAVDAQDEIGRTLRAYNDLLGRLRAIFKDIQESSLRMAEITDEVECTAKEIASNSRNQSEASSDMAAAVEELTVSISMVASQADEANVHTKTSLDQASRGSEVILSTVNDIQHIADSVGEASSRIDELRSDSQSISSVANIIKDIADQTNLLALNAAIEAARAGEQGRGFAVVADEVRKLAERTTKSTQEISSVLERMLGTAGRAVDSMGAVVKQVENGVKTARTAGDSINGIRDGSHTVANAVEEISQAVREQSAASASISQRIEQITDMTERNSAATDSTAEAVHRMNEMSHEIVSALAAYKV